MKRISMIIAAIILLATSGKSLADMTGMVIVSGDTNIINPLNGNMTGVNAGNQQFFKTILDGGSSVVLQNGLNSSNGNWTNDIESFYSGIGVSATYDSGPITASALSGVSTFISIEPSGTFSSAELATLKNFLSAGGNVLLLGDYVFTLNGESTGFIQQNQNINTDLLELGSTIRIVPEAIDELYHTIGPSNIEPDSLTAGVTSFSYAFTSQVTGGTTLFTTQTGSMPFVAAEVIGPTVVPEPSSLLMLGLGVIGVGWRLRARIK